MLDPSVLNAFAVPTAMPAPNAVPAPPAVPADPAQSVSAAPAAGPEAATAAAGGSEPAPTATTEGDPAGAEAASDKVAANLSPAACAALLAERFPALFGAGRALPIKLRIQADIQQRAPGLFNRKSLSIFLHRYTTSTAYLKALAQAPQRLDLDGAPAGDIAQEHRLAAAAEVERRRSLFEERRAAERQAHREAAEQGRRAGAAQNAARHAAQNSAEIEARRQRALLLRAFETTTLTPANFCALKGLVEADLQAQLVQARAEREQRALEPQAPERGPRRNEQEARPGPGERRGGRGSGGRGDDRGGPRGQRAPAGKPPAKPSR